MTVRKGLWCCSGGPVDSNGKKRIPRSRLDCGGDGFGRGGRALRPGRLRGPSRGRTRGSGKVPGVSNCRQFQRTGLFVTALLYAPSVSLSNNVSFTAKGSPFRLDWLFAARSELLCLSVRWLMLQSYATGAAFNPRSIGGVNRCDLLSQGLRRRERVGLNSQIHRESARLECRLKRIDIDVDDWQSAVGRPLRWDLWNVVVNRRKTIGLLQVAASGGRVEYEGGDGGKIDSMTRSTNGHRECLASLTREATALGFGPQNHQIKGVGFDQPLRCRERLSGIGRRRRDRRSALGSVHRSTVFCMRTS